MNSNVEIYEKAQHAINELKSAVLKIVRQNSGVKNVDVGIALGIHKTPDGEHEGYVSSYILRLLKAEGLVEQPKPASKWYPTPTIPME